VKRGVTKKLFPPFPNSTSKVPLGAPVNQKKKRFIELTPPHSQFKKRYFFPKTSGPKNPHPKNVKTPLLDLHLITLLLGLNPLGKGLPTFSLEKFLLI